jgi:hypothetical protein
VIASGVVLAVLAVIELISMKSVMGYQGIYFTDLPAVTFLGNGHLAGYLALVFGGVITRWFRKRWDLLPVMALLIFAMSACFNRTSIVASFFTIPLGYRTPRLVMLAIVVVFSGYFLGQKFLEIQRDRSGQSIAFDDEGNISGRTYMIKMGINGVLDRPVLGFVGSLFSRNWYRYLTKKELKEFFYAAYKWKLLQVSDEQKESIVFLVMKLNGKKTMATISAIKVHNQFLDIGLMWGVPGVILYFLLIVFGLRNLFSLRFESVAIFASLIFSLTWFWADQIHGILFILIALSQAKNVLNDNII